MMLPDALAAALPVLPDLTAGLAALQERLRSMPTMASLPRLPSMAEFSRAKPGSEGPGIVVRAPTAST